MAYDNSVSITGNLTRDPELRFTNESLAVCRLGLAWNQNKGEGNESVAHFFDVVAFGSLADNAACLSKGDRVTVVGRLDYSTWETDDGDKRSKVAIVAEDIAPSLRWAQATVTRNEKKTDSKPEAKGRGGDPFWG